MDSAAAPRPNAPSPMAAATRPEIAVPAAAAPLYASLPRPPPPIMDGTDSPIMAARAAGLSPSASSVPMKPLASSTFLRAARSSLDSQLEANSFASWGRQPSASNPLACWPGSNQSIAPIAASPAPIKPFATTLAASPPKSDRVYFSGALGGASGTGSIVSGRAYPGPISPQPFLPPLVLCEPPSSPQPFLPVAMINLSLEVDQILAPTGARCYLGICFTKLPSPNLADAGGAACTGAGAGPAPPEDAFFFSSSFLICVTSYALIAAPRFGYCF